jgi:hypothetical protein
MSRLAVCSFSASMSCILVTLDRYITSSTSWAQGPDTSQVGLRRERAVRPERRMRRVCTGLQANECEAGEEEDAASVHEHTGSLRKQSG